jgi:hypothetical protein
MAAVLKAIATEIEYHEKQSDRLAGTDDSLCHGETSVFLRGWYHSYLLLVYFLLYILYSLILHLQEIFIKLLFLDSQAKC